LLRASAIDAVLRRFLNERIGQPAVVRSSQRIKLTCGRAGRERA
jgi:hypothetical protein